MYYDSLKDLFAFRGDEGKRYIVRTRTGRYTIIKPVQEWDTIDSDGYVHSYMSDRDGTIYRPSFRGADYTIWERLSLTRRARAKEGEQP